MTISFPLRVFLSVEPHKFPFSLRSTPAAKADKTKPARTGCKWHSGRAGFCFLRRARGSRRLPASPFRACCRHAAWNDFPLAPHAPPPIHGQFSFPFTFFTVANPRKFSFSLRSMLSAKADKTKSARPRRKWHSGRVASCFLRRARRSRRPLRKHAVYFVTTTFPSESKSGVIPPAYPDFQIR